MDPTNCSAGFVTDRTIIPASYYENNPQELCSSDFATVSSIVIAIVTLRGLVLILNFFVAKELSKQRRKQREKAQQRQNNDYYGMGVAAPPKARNNMFPDMVVDQNTGLDKQPNCFTRLGNRLGKMFDRAPITLICESLTWIGALVFVTLSLTNAVDNDRNGGLLVAFTATFLTYYVVIILSVMKMRNLSTKALKQFSTEKRKMQRRIGSKQKQNANANVNAGSSLGIVSAHANAHNESNRSMGPRSVREDSKDNDSYTPFMQSQVILELKHWIMKIPLATTFLGLILMTLGIIIAPIINLRPSQSFWTDGALLVSGITMGLLLLLVCFHCMTIIRLVRGTIEYRQVKRERSKQKNNEADNDTQVRVADAQTTFTKMARLVWKLKVRFWVTIVSLLSPILLVLQGARIAPIRIEIMMIHHVTMTFASITALLIFVPKDFASSLCPCLTPILQRRTSKTDSRSGSRSRDTAQPDASNNQQELTNQQQLANQVQPGFQSFTGAVDSATHKEGEDENEEDGDDGGDAEARPIDTARDLNEELGG